VNAESSRVSVGSDGLDCVCVRKEVISKRYMFSYACCVVYARSYFAYMAVGFAIHGHHLLKMMLPNKTMDGSMHACSFSCSLL